MASAAAPPAAAIRMRWLSESPAVWHPDWCRPTTPTGQRLRSLLAMLDAQPVPLEQVAADPSTEALPLVAQLVLRHGDLVDARMSNPNDILTVALVSHGCADYVRRYLRSSAMDTFWERMACGMVREGAVLHPELVTKDTLSAWLSADRWERVMDPESRSHAPFNRPPPKLWLHAQRWAELFAHFCNVGTEQCRWDGWMRMEILPYVEPDGTLAQIKTGMEPVDFGTHLMSSLSDWMIYHGAQVYTGSLGRTVQTLAKEVANLGVESLFDIARIFAPLFPQECDFDAATGWVDPDDLPSDDEELYQQTLDAHQGTPVPCRWNEVRGQERLPAAEAAKVDTVWSPYTEREISPTEWVVAHSAWARSLPATQDAI